MKRININTENDNNNIKDKNDNETDKESNEIVDKDLVYVPENSRILWSSSWLFLGSSIYCLQLSLRPSYCTRWFVSDIY